MSKSTYTGHRETAYSVNGRKFATYQQAKLFADQLANQQLARTVRIMEKVPGLPCHVIEEIKQ